MLEAKKKKQQLLSEIEAYTEKIHDLQETMNSSFSPKMDPKKLSEFLCNILNSSLDSIAISDATGKFKRVNKAFRDLLGYSREEMVGKMCYEFSIVEPGTYESVTGEQILIEDSFFEESQVMISKLNSEGKVMNWHTYYRRKDGTIVPVEQNIVTISDPHNNSLGAVGIIRDITERRINERLLGEAYTELQKKVDERTAGLEEANIALRVLLQGIDDEKKAVEAKIVSNVHELVIPYLEKMRQNPLDTTQRTYLDVAERNLKDIISPFLQSLSTRDLKLTPIEIQVAALIKQGKSSKQIADIMHLSHKTIETHRKNIRAKLGLRNKKSNLRTYLQTLSL